MLVVAVSNNGSYPSMTLTQWNGNYVVESHKF